ncbi:hypothetical protein C8J57DRAFT_1622149 [Mycena rebaudengoi]|nr:hypothetical protein C8J57DRAFT_1622149 [Mycena rebaudengoi]
MLMLSFLFAPACASAPGSVLGLRGGNDVTTSRGLMLHDRRPAPLGRCQPTIKPLPPIASRLTSLPASRFDAPDALKFLRVLSANPPSHHNSRASPVALTALQEVPHAAAAAPVSRDPGAQRTNPLPTHIE